MRLKFSSTKKISRFAQNDKPEHVSASRQDPNGVFLARAPVLSEFLFFRNLNIVTFPENPEQ